jgi:hypothetical protein
MCVCMGQFLCQAVMGWALVLKCLVRGAYGCLWLRPIMPGSKWLLLCQDLAAVELTRYWRSPGCDYRWSGWVTKRIYSGLVGGKILTVRRYCDGREDQYALFPGLVLFRLVTPPLQPGVVGPYPIWDTWFPSRLSLKGTSRIQKFWP